MAIPPSPRCAGLDGGSEYGTKIYEGFETFVCTLARRLDEKGIGSSPSTMSIASGSV
jgi:hypothetical protein